MFIRRTTLLNLLLIGLVIGGVALAIASVNPSSTAALPALTPTDELTATLTPTDELTATLILIAPTIGATDEITATTTLTPTAIMSVPTATVAPILTATATLIVPTLTPTATISVPTVAPTEALTDTIAWIWWTGGHGYMTTQMMRAAQGSQIWVPGGPIMRLDQRGGQQVVSEGVLAILPRPDLLPLLITAPNPTGSFTITDPLNGHSVPVDINATVAYTLPKGLFFSHENNQKKLDQTMLAPDGSLLAYSLYIYDWIDHERHYEYEITLTDLRTGATRTLFPAHMTSDEMVLGTAQGLIGWQDHTLYGWRSDAGLSKIWRFDSDTGLLDEEFWPAGAESELVAISSSWMIYSLSTDQERVRDYWFLQLASGEQHYLGQFEPLWQLAVTSAPPWQVAAIETYQQLEAPDALSQRLLLGSIADERPLQVITSNLGLHSSVAWLSERYLGLKEGNNEYITLFSTDPQSPDNASVWLSPPRAFLDVSVWNWSGAPNLVVDGQNRLLWSQNNCSISESRPIRFRLNVEPLDHTEATQFELGPMPLETSGWVDCAPPKIVYTP